MSNFFVKSLQIAAFAVLPHFVSAQGQMANAPTTDAKLTPNISSNNNSIGNIFSPSLFDGSAHIRVPIYQFNNESGDFGVSLGYNTKGVKVDEISGIIGMHWSLNANGSIRRVMKDIPDEENLNGADSTLLFPYTKIRGKYVTYSETPTEALDQKVYRDGESDDFVVSLGSLNFTFNLGKDFHIFTHPKSNARVSILVNGSLVNSIPTNSGNNLLEFVIYDEQGVAYYFKSGDISMLELEDGDALNPNTVAAIPYTSRWVIDKIVFPNGTKITYTYTAFTAGSTPLYQSVTRIENPNAYPLTYQSSSVRGYDIGNTVVQLSSIQYPNNTLVEFLYAQQGEKCDDPGQPTLREITVSNGTCMRYKMDQAFIVNPIPGYTSYFNEVPFGSTCISTYPPNNFSIPDYSLFHRMILKGIRTYSCDNSQSEPYYTFEYSDIKLPPRTSCAQDFFGYYNAENIPVNSTWKYTIPNHNDVLGTGGNYGVNRNYHPVAAAAGLIKRVNNAYGGTVEFEYEGHELYNMPIPGGLPTDNAFLGKDANDGVRIKNVTEYDVYHLNVFKVSRYTYGGGQRFLTGGYFHFPTGLTNGIPNQVIFNGIYVTPHQMVNGSNHGYSEVTVTTRNETGQLLGSRLTTFTNFQDETSSYQARYFVKSGGKHFHQWPFTDKQYLRDWELGLPLSILEFDENNQIVSETNNKYEFTIDTTSMIGKVENLKTMKVRGEVIATENYRPFTGTSHLVRSNTKKYYTNTMSVNDTLWFTYDNKNNLKRTRVRDSKGQFYFVDNVYNYDVSGTNTSNVLINMNNSNLSKIISTERWKEGSNKYNNTLLNSQITGYNLINGNLLSQNIFQLEYNDPIPFTQYTGVSISNPSDNPYIKIKEAYNSSNAQYFQKLSEVQLFDSKGNPIETKFLNQNIYKSMIWDTVTGQKLAEAASARYNEIAYSGFDASHKGNWSYVQGNIVSNNTINGGGIDGKYALKIQNTDPSPISVSGLTTNKSYTLTFWCKGGTPQLSGGIPVSMIYAPGNGWAFFKANIPAGTSSVGLTSTGSPSSPFIYYIDNIRLFPENAQMQSWTNDPLFGATSVTPENGRITYIEYDMFGRESVIRDQEKKIMSRKTYQLRQP